MLKANIENYLACDAQYGEAGIVLYGAPFDSTTSYRPGARFGSRAIRAESYGLESYSPYQDKDLADCAVFDSGDLELSFGSTGDALTDLRSRAGEILKDRKIPFMTGGEHLVTLAAVRAAKEIYQELHLIHFDAHADLRDTYLGVKLSHACVIRRCHEHLGDGRIHQFGIRSGDREEWSWGRAHTAMHPYDLSEDALQQTLEALKGKPVYLTVDLDVLDPSVLPGTGTPEPGGVSFEELRRAVTQVCRGAKIVGADVCELAPMLDMSGGSTAVACKIVREMLIGLG